MVGASELKAKDPGFDPLAGQGESLFFCPSESTLVQACLCLTPLCVYGTHQPEFVCKLKIPKQPVVKLKLKLRAGLTARGMVTHKYCIH